MSLSLRTTRRRFLVGSAAGCGSTLLGSPGLAAINRSGAGGLSPPSNGSFLVPIIRKLELDRKNGIDFDINLYSDPSILYSDLAAERTSHIFGALYNCANFYVRGVPLQLLFTITTANHAFVSKNPGINDAQDLRDKTVAATTSSGFYGMAILFLRQNKLDPRRNMNIVNAAPSGVQTQLLAEKADAGLVFDPALSDMLAKGYHLVGNMNDGIRKALSMKAEAPVWYLGAYGQKDWIDANPERVAATFAMWKQAAAFYDQSPEEADKLISEFARIPVEALRLSRKLGLTTFKVEPAIEQRETLSTLFSGFHDVGFLSQVPDDGIYYRWPKKSR